MKYMTKADRDELREMIQDILSPHAESTNGKFELIKNQLDRVEAQTTRTNGRVSKLEVDVINLTNKEANHIITCPQNERIRKIEEEHISTSSIKKFLLSVLAVLVGLAAIVTLIVKLL